MILLWIFGLAPIIYFSAEELATWITKKLRQKGLI